MGKRESVISLGSIWSAIKDVFGITPSEKGIDNETAKEVAALRAESGKDISELENSFTSTKLQQRQAFEKGIKEEVKPLEPNDKPKAKMKDIEDERIK